MQLSTILDQIDIGTYALPEFQRGYVWTREQVRKLMTSLYHGYPIGSLLIWVTKTDRATTRGDATAPYGTVNLYSGWSTANYQLVWNYSKQTAFVF